MMKTSETTHGRSKSIHPQHWFESGQQDIARMIERTIAPYVDHGNVSLQHDELRDECWFKMAKLLTSSTMERCQTRQQFFALVKVSLRNHVKSLVHKYAFTVKYTGIPVHPKGKKKLGPEQRKTRYVRLDDPNELFELAADDSETQTGALLRDFASVLSASDRLMLHHLIVSHSDYDAPKAQSLRARYKEFLGLQS